MFDGQYTTDVQDMLYPELWDGCVGAWSPIVGPTGTTLIDWSHRRNHGILTNFTLSAAWDRNAGYQSVLADGVNDYIVTGSQNYNFGNNGSCAVWWNPVATNGITKIVVGHHGSGLAGYDTSGWLINYIGGALAYYWKSAGSVVMPSINPVVGEISHIGFSNNNGVMTAFLNGRAVATGTAGGAITGAQPMNFGGAGAFYGNMRFFSVRVYDRGLSPSEFALLSQYPGIEHEHRLHRSFQSANASGRLLSMRRKAVAV